MSFDRFLDGSLSFYTFLMVYFILHLVVIQKSLFDEKLGAGQILIGVNFFSALNGLCSDFGYYLL